MARCSSCGQDNPGEARFCSACGARFEPALTGGERKIVSVLFVDVTGSTGLADRLDAEELREVMSAWFAAIRTEIEAQGGTVEKYIGDAVMAVFGVPVAHEDDPARALRAALAVRDRLVGLNDELAESHALRIEIRTGINTGEAVTTASPAPGEGMVTGVAVNAAARLEQLAEPGQILVAERTVRATPGFRFDDLGLLELRGKEERVHAFSLLEEEREAPIRGIPGVRAPLVGRDQELDLLLSLQERVTAERRPQLVTIYGDPGVGKSRLVQELFERLASLPDPPRILVGPCLSYGDGIAYWPLAEILKNLARVSDDDPAGIVLRRIDELVESLLGGTAAHAKAATAAALAFTLGLDGGSTEFARLQPTSIRAELHKAWRAVLSAAAEQGPLVVAVEDIHWADPVLLDLLEEVAERAQGPLLFVCPARPALTDWRPTWGGGRRSFSAVFLGPLSPESAGVLAGHLLDVDGLPEAARSRILERAEGNPFFLEEILRQLIDEGRIVREGTRWQATDGLEHVALPDTVQAVLAARIDLLEPSEKHTLQQASVVGRVFWRGAVTALVADQETVDPDLRRLEERELVTERLTSSLLGEEELAFSHILTRDVAYETLPRRERPKAHALVASWIEETTGDRRGEFVGLLAHHYWEAYRGARLDRSYDSDELERLRERAFQLLVEGSTAALRGAAYRGARSLAESALEVAATPEERAAAFEALGHGFKHAGFGDGAWSAFTGGADALIESDSSERAFTARLCGLALETVCRWTGTIGELPDEATAVGYLDAGLARLGDDDGEARVRLMTAESFWAHAFPQTALAYGDPSVAYETGLAAAAMAERLGRLDLAVVALDAVQHNLQRQLRYDDAEAAARHRLEVARSAGDLAELGDSYAVAAWNTLYLGSFADARAVGRGGYESLVSDAPVYAAHALAWSALAAFYLGDWDGLLADLALVIASLGERADTPTSGFSAPWPAAAFAYEARGDRRASERLLEQTYAIEQRRGAISVHLSPQIVETLIHRGELTAARERMDTALDPGTHRDNLPLLLCAEAELLVCEERWAELPAFAGYLRSTGAESGARYLAPVADRLDGRAALAANDFDEAGRLLEAAASGFTALEMAVEAALAGLDATQALIAAGRHDEARSIATRAREPLERAGYVRALDRAGGLLSGLS